MQKQLVIVENIFEPTSWIRLETDDVCRSLMEHFGEWPDNARLYNGQVAQSHDITPFNEKEVERIAELDGPFYAVVAPKDISLPVLIAIAIVAIVTVVAFMPKPNIPIAATRTTNNPSPNNDLAARANKPRINARIPDIYGTEISIPDLLAMPYSLYVDDVENVHDFMCIGRGWYEVKAEHVKDAETRISQIQGAAVDVYPPFTSPNFGAPQLRVGSYKPPKLFSDGIETIVGDALRRLLATARCKSVNGQILYAPNDAADREDYKDSIRFVPPNKIVSVRGEVTFDKFFGKPNLIVVTSNHRNCDGCYMFNFSGNYKISSVTSTEITLEDPGSVSNSWYRLNFEDASKGNYGGAYGIPGHSVGLAATESSSNWVGPFVIDSPDADSFIANFVAQNGLYKDDGKDQTAIDVTLEVGIRPIGVAGLPSGKESFYQVTLQGSATKRSQKAVSLGPQKTQFKGRFAARARRLTPKIRDFAGQITDDVKWKDLYGAWDITQPHFGDITTVRSITLATPNATAISDRELNMLVTRKLPRRLLDGTFSSELYPTKNAADIFCHVAFDPKIGNRKPTEVDVSQIYSTVDAVSSYFGTSQAAQFCYTFDNDNITPEETLATIARAIFCEAFRRGKTIKLAFDKAGNSPVLLFNHRNKVPKTEKRTITFGPTDDNDGLEYEYISPKDGSLTTIYLPTDRSAVNPKKIESIGVRNHRQAHFHAWRLYNRMRYQHILVEFEALQESNILMRNDRILVADNTNSKTKDGEVIKQDALALKLSQKHGMVGGTNYVIFLQHVDGSVQTLPVVPGADEYSVLLLEAPALPLCVDHEASVRAGYIIVPESNNEPHDFIVVERDPQSNFTSDLKAINYADEYYENDKDFIKGLLPSAPVDSVVDDSPPSSDPDTGLPIAASYTVQLRDNWTNAFGPEKNAAITFQANGILYLGARMEWGVLTETYPPGEWLKAGPKPTDVTSLFEIRATLVSATLTQHEMYSDGVPPRFAVTEAPEGQPMNTWLSLDADRQWFYRPKERPHPVFGDPIPYNSIDANIRYEIKRKANEEILASAVITFSHSNPVPDAGGS